jgi:hypothetical protein
VHNADAVQFAKRLQNLLQNAPHNQGVSLGLLVATRRSCGSQAAQTTSKVRKSDDRPIRWVYTGVSAARACLYAHPDSGACSIHNFGITNKTQYQLL